MVGSILGTYRDQAAAGHNRMTISIEEFRASRELLLDRILLQPFRCSAAAIHNLEERGVNKRDRIMRLSVGSAARGSTCVAEDPSNKRGGWLFWTSKQDERCAFKFISTVEMPRGTSRKLGGNLVNVVRRNPSL